MRDLHAVSPDRDHVRYRLQQRRRAQHGGRRRSAHSFDKMPIPFHAQVRLDSEYVQRVVEQELRQSPWVALEPEGSTGNSSDDEYADREDASSTASSSSASSLRWLEFEEIDWPAVLRGNGANGVAGMASSYCVRKGLIRKAQFAVYLRKFMAKRPNSTLHGAVPETFVFELEHPDYVDEVLCDLPEVKYMEEGKDVFILKPSLLNQAKSIHIIRSCEQFEEIMGEQEDDDDEDEDEDGGSGKSSGEMTNSMIREWVIQRYINNPLLVRGKKFHIRTYVLACGNLSVYVFTQMLALFAVRPYESEEFSTASHITNTCANKDHPDFDEAESVNLLSEILTPEQHERIVSRITAVVGDVFEAMHGEPTAFMPLPNCFEHYGFDFLLDDTMNVWVLEANAGPDFAQTGDRLQHLVRSFMYATRIAAVDPYYESATMRQRGTPMPDDDVKYPLNAARAAAQLSSEQLDAASLKLAYQRLISQSVGGARISMY